MQLKEWLSCSRFRVCSHAVLVLTVLLIACYPIGAWASSEKVLHEFVEFKNGARPQAALVADSAGNLYATTPDGGKLGDGVVFELIPGSGGKYSYKVLYSFTGGNDGKYPYAGVTVDAAGNLWGAAADGGANGCGTVFRLNPVHGRWDETTIYSFCGANGDGAVPMGGLTFDRVGRIFGTTAEGGDRTRYSEGQGTAFMLVKQASGNWVESVIHVFEGQSTDGWYPESTLAIDDTGHLYGVTPYGGRYDENESCQSYCGTLFMLSPSPGLKGTWTETILHNFGGSYGDGIEPVGALTLDAAGNLYGTTPAGGVGSGTVFELSPMHGGNWTETTLYTFSGQTDGSTPYDGVIFDENGNLYGTTYGGGRSGCGNGCGTVFKLSPESGGAWKKTRVHTFLGAQGGGSPYAGVTIDSNGNLYGTTSAGGPVGVGVAFKMKLTSRRRWEETVLFGFPITDGAAPAASLVFDGMNLYGTTENGGDCGLHSSGYDCGTVFELTPESGGRWTSKIIHQFAASNDGQNPVAGLVADQSGNLYGTTMYGGTAGRGTVFELAPNANGGWAESVLYNFQGGQDGADPTGPLILDNAGNLYGTTSDGNCGYYYCNGVVFELSPSGSSWTETVLYSFTGGSDGANPAAGLVFDDVGNLYGTTPWGGTYGEGTVFMLSPGSGGWVESTIYAFTGQNGDGAVPLCTLIFDGVGSLYGTTTGGGNERGTVFRLSPSGASWSESVLYSFGNGGGDDGADPAAGVVFDTTGSLYGTTEGGGTYSGGTVFKLASSGGSWTETVVYSFTGGSDGSRPVASLVLDGNGTLYGTTVNSSADGVAFSMTP